MATFLNSASAVMLILLMTAVGYVCGRLGWIKHEDKRFLVKFIMNLALPAMCINGLLGSMDHDLLASAGPLLLAPLCAIVALTLLAFPLGRLLKLRRERFGVFMVMCIVANSMFIGYPMCTALFGDAAVPYVLCYYMVNTVIFQTVGVALLNYSGRPDGARVSPFSALRRLIKPTICTILACILLLALNIKLPTLVMSLAKYLGNTVSPLGLLYTGFVIYEMGFSHLRMDASLWVALGVRFIVSPLLCVLFCRLFGVDGLARNVLMIEMAMPVMTQTVVLSADSGADEQYAAVGATASTLACFVAIPILMFLA